MHNVNGRGGAPANPAQGAQPCKITHEITRLLKKVRRDPVAVLIALNTVLSTLKHLLGIWSQLR